MGDFCWLTGPGVCGKLTFDLPVAEVFVVALVSGLVTWATIFFSIKAARKETERALSAQKIVELRAAISALAEEADQRLKDADWAAHHTTTGEVTADVVIRTSGRVGAAEAARWARLVRQDAVITELDSPSVSAFGMHFYREFQRHEGPGLQIVATLSEWIVDPEKTTPELARQNNEMFHRLKVFVNKKIDEDTQRWADQQPGPPPPPG